MQHLSGRILKPSMESRFETEYTSSLAVIPANLSALQEKDREKQTPDTFGRILKNKSAQLDLFSASSKMSVGTLQSDSRTFTEAYEIWVTQLRQDCLRRQSAEHPTNGNGFSSWPTVQASNIGSDAETNRARMKRLKAEGRQTGGIRNLNQVVQEQVGNWPTHQNRDSTRETSIKRDRLPDIIRGLHDPDSPNTNGKSQELNPDWVESLMGLPTHWTLIED